jgi:prophage regulatory protein
MPTDSHAQKVPRLFACLPVVLSVTGLGRSTVYRMVADGSFPRPIRLGRRAIAWRWTDLDEWSRQRPPGAC